MSEAGQVIAQTSALSPIPVPLAELFKVAAEHERHGRLDDAERLLGHILAAEPKQADALHLSGVIAFRRTRRTQARDLMEQSIEYGINTPLYWRNLGEVYRTLGQLDQALTAGRRAVRLNPDDATTLSNLAIIHMERAEFDDAARCTREALALDPTHVGAHFGRAEQLLLQGEMAAGWEEYEWRFQMPSGPRNLPPPGKRPPQWDGRAMPDTKLLVIADQGFGDIIQFCRYVPWILERCSNVAVACSNEAQALLRQFGLSHFYDTWDALPLCAAYVPLSGLPRLAGCPVGGAPAVVPYLSADPVHAAAWRARLDALAPAGFQRIGLVWAGRPEHANDYRRSAPLSALAPLFALERTVLVSLQKGQRRAETGSYLGQAPLLNLGPALGDWNDTMAVIDGLDAVVSVDTSVAHLAGAMAKPVHILLPRSAEWRWLRERADSPWYPTATLHRQSAMGEGCKSVCASIATALAVAAVPLK